MGGLDKVDVGIEIDEAQRDAAVLPQAEDLALVPEPEVHLCELEPVIGLCQRLEALPRRRLRSALGPDLGQDIAGTGIRPSSHATA